LHGLRGSAGVIGAGILGQLTRRAGVCYAEAIIKKAPGVLEHPGSGKPRGRAGLRPQDTIPGSDLKEYTRRRKALFVFKGGQG